MAKVRVRMENLEWRMENFWGEVLKWVIIGITHLNIFVYFDNVPI
jgi:hypothetical protein